MDQLTRMVETPAGDGVWASLKDGPHDDKTLARLCVTAARQFVSPTFLNSLTTALCGRDVDGCAPNQEKGTDEKGRGMAAFRTGDLTEASSAFTAALANIDEFEAPEAAAALYLNRAAIDLKEGRASGAMQNCDCAMECEGGNAKALYRRAQAHAALGDAEGARADVEALSLSGKATVQEANALMEHLMSEVYFPALTDTRENPGRRVFLLSFFSPSLFLPFV
jgi:tetratricopeptide (TPR) repeat protein